YLFFELQIGTVQLQVSQIFRAAEFFGPFFFPSWLPSTPAGQSRANRSLQGHHRRREGPSRLHKSPFPLVKRSSIPKKQGVQGPKSPDRFHASSPPLWARKRTNKAASARNGNSRSRPPCSFLWFCIHNSTKRRMRSSTVSTSRACRSFAIRR